MPIQKWEQIQEVFLAAVELPPMERGAYLDSACLGDGRLRSEVESLLRADTNDPTIITSAIEYEVNSLLDGDNPVVGTRVGPYRLLKEIGRGGMGFVYLGERDDEHYRKRVAIKVVKRGMDSAEVLARFRHERQILAGLEHPYIARLLDGGTTSDGRPFFVMEEVQGRPIDVYCREEKLSLQVRMRLFERVCEAVSYAHRALVVHRDLKPSNIMVTAEGIPKLLDFGVAKLLDAGVDPGLTTLSANLGPLTPEYASPEQILGLPITTATDVYALGAVLFEMLTGARAQKITTHSPTEIERVVCEAETPAPSSVARTAGNAMRLDGDVDNIVLMAMRKEPERRYGTVSQMSEDVYRYLHGHPVHARQASVGYRALKFLRRHGFVVGATAAVVASLIGGTALAVMQARRAEMARGVAETQRQSAEHEKARAEAQKQEAERERARAEAETVVAKTEQDRSQRRLTQMLELANRSLFDVHSAVETLPGATEARRQIVATTLSFLQDLSKDVAQDDRLRFMLSVSYLRVGNVLGSPLQPNLGDTKGALENYERAAIMIDPLVKNEPDRAEYIRQWVETKTAWAAVLDRNGEQPRAAAMLRETLPPARRLQKLCPKDPKCWTAEEGIYSELVESLGSIDSGAALQYSQMQVESLERGRRAAPNHIELDLELAIAYSQNAKLHNGRGELREAVEGYRKAVALREEALRRNPADVLTRRSLMVTYGNLGGNLGSPIYLNLGDSAGAREYYGKALAIARDLANADKNNQLAQYDLANALLFSSLLNLPKEQLETALANLKEAEEILRKLIAADPGSIPRARTLAIVLEYKGRRLEALGRRDEAIVQYRESLDMAEKVLPRSPSDLSLVGQVLASTEDIAEALAQKGERAEALATAQRAVTRAEQVSSSASDRDRAMRLIAIAYQTLGTVQAANGDWKTARESAERAVNEWNQMLTSGSHRVDSQKKAAAEALLQSCIAHTQ